MYYLILYEVKCFYHVVDSDLPVHADGKHGNDAALEAVAEYERGATSLLHVEGDAFQAAHVEERLVLDCS